jgi:gas vesicle protein
MRKFGQLILGAIVGGLIGGSLGLLFAPASGEQTRNNIQGYFENLQEEINRAADEKRAELEEQLRSLRSGKDISIKN